MYGKGYRKSSKRLTLEEVKERFSKDGWVLLDTQYKNYDTRLLAKCPCGNITRKSLRGLKNGKGCRLCANQQIAKRQRLSYSEVKQAFEKAGFVLLEKKYKNIKTPMLCICVCGEETYKTYESIRDGQLCKACGYKNRKVYYGEDNPAYNPNLTEIERLTGRRYPKYKEWSFKVKERDNFKCVLCGSRKQINSHHLNGYDNFPDLRLELSNGVTLCYPCHEDFHREYGYGNNTKEQFYEYKDSRGGVPVREKIS